MDRVYLTFISNDLFHKAFSPLGTIQHCLANAIFFFYDSKAQHTHKTNNIPLYKGASTFVVFGNIEAYMVSTH